MAICLENKRFWPTIPNLIFENVTNNDNNANQTLMRAKALRYYHDSIITIHNVQLGDSVRYGVLFGNVLFVDISNTNKFKILFASTEIHPYDVSHPYAFRLQCVACNNELHNQFLMASDNGDSLSLTTNGNAYNTIFMFNYDSSDGHITGVISAQTNKELAVDPFTTLIQAQFHTDCSLRVYFKIDTPSAYMIAYDGYDPIKCCNSGYLTDNGRTIICNDQGLKGNSPGTWSQGCQNTLQTYCTGTNLTTPDCLGYCSQTSVNCDNVLQTFCQSVGKDSALSTYGDICGCHMGHTFYSNYFTSLKEQYKDVWPPITPENPFCYFPECSQSLMKSYFSKQNGFCPSIINCVAKVEVNNQGTIIGNVDAKQSIQCGNTTNPDKNTPGPPSNVIATPGNGQASITFTPPTLTSVNSPIIGYTVTSNPGALSTTGTTTTLTVAGLANGSSYVFSVKAINSAGAGAASSYSNTIVPLDTYNNPSNNTLLKNWKMYAGIGGVIIVLIIILALFLLLRNKTNSNSTNNKIVILPAPRTTMPMPMRMPMRPVPPPSAKPPPFFSQQQQQQRPMLYVNPTYANVNNSNSLR